MPVPRVILFTFDINISRLIDKRPKLSVEKLDKLDNVLHRLLDSGLSSRGGCPDLHCHRKCRIFAYKNLVCKKFKYRYEKEV